MLKCHETNTYLLNLDNPTIVLDFLLRDLATLYILDEIV